MPDKSPPSPDNSFHEDHALLLANSYYQVTGKRLIICPQTSLGERLFFAPFALVSHDTASDPIFNYANQTALDLFEMGWEQFTTTPSRQSAEQPLREERARLLDAVNANGYIDDYTGIRISSSGRRFFIENATVWNLVDGDQYYGQAAMFSTWKPVD